MSKYAPKKIKKLIYKKKPTKLNKLIKYGNYDIVCPLRPPS